MAQDKATPGLKEAFAGDFQVGAALNSNQVAGGDPEAMSLVARQFNSVTAENVMKWQSIEPTEGVFDWEAADALVDYAGGRGMAVIGHVLVWHQQTPDWVFESEPGVPASRELLLQRMENHISEVVGRYRGRIHAWEVVNEALEDNGSLRQTPWLEIIGEDYLDRAFEYARTADPDVRLYYNDYNLYLPAKAAAARALIAGLRDRGQRVDGAGLQGHYDLNSPADLGQFDAAIKGFGGMGLEVYITELDLSVLPWPPSDLWGVDLGTNPDLDAQYNPFKDGLPAQAELRQAKRYARLFRILLANRHFVSRVTFWGVNDGHNWKNHWPISGRTDYPLLFDRDNQPKAAFEQIQVLARPRTGR